MVQRMQSGRAIKQTHFSKLRTVLSGMGWSPVGLDGLDYSKPLLLKCAVPQGVTSLNTQIFVTAKRRRDPGFEAKGYGLVNGQWAETSTNIGANIVELIPVEFATLYQVVYYPEILVFAEPPHVQGNVSGAEFSWSLSCEEI